MPDVQGFLKVRPINLTPSPAPALGRGVDGLICEGGNLIFDFEKAACLMRELVDTR